MSSLIVTIAREAELPARRIFAGVPAASAGSVDGATEDNVKPFHCAILSHGPARCWHAAAASPEDLTFADDDGLLAEQSAT
jgi:hypothetical protein